MSSSLQELHAELLAQGGGLLPVARGEQPAGHPDLGRPQLLVARGRAGAAATRFDAFRYPERLISGVVSFTAIALAILIQSDTAGSSKPPIDFKTKVPFFAWPGLA